MGIVDGVVASEHLTEDQIMALELEAINYLKERAEKDLSGPVDVREAVSGDLKNAADAAAITADPEFKLTTNAALAQFQAYANAVKVDKTQNFLVLGFDDIDDAVDELKVTGSPGGALKSWINNNPNHALKGTKIVYFRNWKALYFPKNSTFTISVRSNFASFVARVPLKILVAESEGTNLGCPKKD